MVHDESPFAVRNSSFAKRVFEYSMNRLLCTSLAIALAACSSDSNDSSGPNGSAIVASIAISPATLTIAVGQTGTLTATPRTSAGDPIAGRTIAWSSNNGGVASVNGGVVTGVSAGNVTITASTGGVSQTAAVTVTATGGQAQAVFSAIAPGHHHTCAVAPAGAAYCWGSNQYGQLGTGVVAGIQFTPTAVSTTQVFSAVSSGSEHSCALTTAGNAYCWGWNFYGQLGDGTNTQRNVPTAVNTAVTFTSISTTSDSHACALTATGVAYCWGNNVFGQLGDGTTTARMSPVAVIGAPGPFASISVGNRHTCARTTTSRAYCWGDVQYIGRGTLTGGNASSPTEIAGGLFYKSVVAGWASACGITTNDATYCWGLYTSGSSPILPPTLVPNITYALVAPSNMYVCGLVGAAATCFGINNTGQHGDGTSTTHATPVPASGGIAFSNLVVGNGITCGLTANNLAYCWGLNSSGQGGVGHQLGNLTPSPVRAP
jgi:hypothetical protein